MADAKTYTQVEVDAIVEDARSEGVADGLSRAWDWLADRATQLEEADKDKGFFEAEIAILRWASKRLGSL